MDFLQQLHFEGFAIGLLTFAIIGIFHPFVVKGEYYFGTRIRWVFLVSGLAALAGCILVQNTVVSAGLGVLGFTCLWSIKEIIEQRERVRKGWFPKNPKRKYPF